MSELYQHSTQQWDDMYADQQRAKQEIGELKIRHCFAAVLQIHSMVKFKLSTRKSKPIAKPVKC